MALFTGRYTIMNVMWENYAHLPDANPNTGIIGATNDNTPKTQACLSDMSWKISRDGNIGNQYWIINAAFDKYASINTQNVNVVGHSECLTHWTIKETEKKGQYTIETTKGGQFWKLEAANINAPIVLGEDPTNDQGHWIFESAQVKA